MIHAFLPELMQFLLDKGDKAEEPAGPKQKGNLMEWLLAGIPGGSP